MSAFPTQHTYAANEALTAANLNTHPQGITWLTSGRPHCSVRQSSATTNVPNNAWTTIPCDTIDVDTENGYNTSTGVYTVAQPGWYLITCAIAYAPNTTGDRAAHITASYGQIPGVELTPTITSNSGYITSVNYATLATFTAGQTVYLQGLQTSGGTLATALNGATGQYTFMDVLWIRG